MNKFTVAIVLLLVFFVCFSQADEHTLFLSKLKKAVSSAKQTFNKAAKTVRTGVSKVKKVSTAVKKVVSTAKKVVGKVKETANKIKDKLMTFARYGNHCGKGYGTAGVPAIDAVDTACYQHDRCYEAFGFGNCGCDRDAIVAIKKAMKSASLKAKAAGTAGLFWLSKHGCNYVYKTGDGTCVKGINKNLKGSDKKAMYDCNTATYTAPNPPNKKKGVAKKAAPKKAVAKKAVPAGKKLDKEVNTDNKKIKKLEALLGGKKAKKSVKSVKKTTRKTVTKKSGKTVKKSTKKTVTKKTTKRASGKKVTKKSSKSVKKLEARANRQIRKLNKASKKGGKKSRKAGKKSRKGGKKSRKAGKKGSRKGGKKSRKGGKKSRKGCGSGLAVSFSGKTTISIDSVKI